MGRWACQHSERPSTRPTSVAPKPEAWGAEAEAWGYQRNKVPGVLPPEVPQQLRTMRDEEDGARSVVGPDVLPDKALHLPDEGEHSHSGQGHRQLQGPAPGTPGEGERLRAPLQHSCPRPQAPRPTLRMKAWRMLLSSQLVAGSPGCHSRMGAPPRDSSHDEVLRSRTGSQHPSLMWEPLPSPCPAGILPARVLCWEGLWLSVGVGGKGALRMGLRVSPWWVGPWGSPLGR